MAEPKTIFDEADETLEAEAIERARAEIAAGEGISQEAVEAWLRRLAKGERAAPPVPD